MSDGALEATERQFLSLLGSAGADFHIQLSLYHFPEVPRGNAARRHMDRRYQSVNCLWNTRLDGLIVTGREPVFPDLRAEPYWDSFVQVHEWARDNTFSTIWSCLAAHAAVLHGDGIKRQKSHQKHCGIFDCSRVSDHPLLKHTSNAFRLPHSRWNGLPESELTRCGYQILTLVGDAGVDSFVRQDSSLFVYFQGHPEYEPETILLEYRRDVNRYLNGESADYPALPRGYFDLETERDLKRIQNEAASRPHKETLALVESITSSAENVDGWAATASALYKNWLNVVHRAKCAREQKARSLSTDKMSSVPEPLKCSELEVIEDAVA